MSDEYREKLHAWADVQIRIQAASAGAAQTYTNVIIGTGYAAYFLMWNSLSDKLTDNLMLSSAFAMVLSLSGFIGFEVFRMGYTVVQTSRWSELANPPGADIVERVRQIEAQHGRMVIHINRWWPFAFAFTITTALFAVGAMLYVIVGSLFWGAESLSTSDPKLLADGEVQSSGTVEGTEQIFGLLTGAGELLPVTVVAAIVLFVVKEALEEIRRRKANARKRRVIRRLIANEIERNNWTIKRLRHGLIMIDEYLTELESKIRIYNDTFGERHFRLEVFGEMSSQSPVGKVHTEALSASILTIPEIDEAIFDRALELSDAMKELDHVLKSMVENFSIDDDNPFIESFREYATEEINDCEKELQSFYKTITGRELKEHRVR